jgi:hypothetical protein
MGVSTFRIAKVAPGYAGALAKVVVDAWRGRQKMVRARESNS